MWFVEEDSLFFFWLVGILKSIQHMDRLDSMTLLRYIQICVGRNHVTGRRNTCMGVTMKSQRELPYFSTRTGREFTGLINGLNLRGRMVSIFALNLAERSCRSFNYGYSMK
jgi:hypothetical protein